MNDCEIWSERLALRLYGELDASELAELDMHLRDCAECRARETELAAGLGRLRGGVAHAEDDGPAHARLRRALSSELHSGSRALAPALVGFAAGVLCALGLAALRRGGAASTGAARVDAAPAFARATPPPTAQDRGLGVALAAVSRR